MKLNGYIGYAICEECEKVFPLKKPVYRYVNAGAKGTVIEDFESYKFNRVKCKFCKAEFNYEMPLVIYNPKDNYIVFTGDNTSREDRLTRLLEILGLNDFKIYRVPYYAFAVEVINAQKAGLDYNFVVDIKNRELDALKYDIKKEYIIFNKYENGVLYYHHLNYLNEVKNTYEIKYDNKE